MAKRAKQEEIPMEGPGVAPVKDKVLDKLCEEFIELKDEICVKKVSAKELEDKILDRLGELKLTDYRFGTQQVVVNIGKTKIKIERAEGEPAPEDLENEED